MALTVTEIWRGKFQSRMLNGYTVVFDSSYASLGEAITANQLGLGRIDAVIPIAAVTGQVVIWDPTNSKLRSFVSGSTSAVTGSSSAGPVLQESSAGTDLSTLSTTILVIGL